MSFFFPGLIVDLAASLIVGLAIGGVVSMALEIAIDLLRWSLWNKQISFLKC